MSKQREGYLFIDHTQGPGVTEADLAKIPKKARGLAVPGGTKVDTATITCAHCQRQIIRNPWRQRERNRCWECFKYICDDCAVHLKVSGRCVTYEAVFDKLGTWIANGKAGVQTTLDFLRRSIIDGF